MSHQKIHHSPRLQQLRLAARDAVEVVFAFLTSEAGLVFIGLIVLCDVVAFVHALRA